MKDTALRFAGIVFLMMAIVHLLRVFLGFGVIIAGYVLPLWSSIVAVIFLLSLSIWMFKSINAPNERRELRIKR